MSEESGVKSEEFGELAMKNYQFRKRKRGGMAEIKKRLNSYVVQCEILLAPFIPRVYTRGTSEYST